MQMHYAPCHEITCTIELRLFNPTKCVPNLVAIAQNFLEPEDPSQINFSATGARSLHRTGSVTTKHIAWGSIHVTCKFGISRVHRLGCRGEPLSFALSLSGNFELGTRNLVH